MKSKKLQELLSKIPQSTKDKIDIIADIMTLQNEMTNREKFLVLVSRDLTEKTMKDVNYRIENREAIQGYQKIAMKILRFDSMRRSSLSSHIFHLPSLSVSF